MLSRANYASALISFLDAPIVAVFGELSQNHSWDVVQLQRNAWLRQISNMKEQLAGLGRGFIFLEFSIPRMGRRSDGLLITAGIIFVIEYKTESDTFDQNAVDQVLDYALDLKNFHAGSHDKPIAPILVALNAQKPEPTVTHWFDDGVAHPSLSNGADLLQIIEQVIDSLPTQPDFDPEEWVAEGYKPTPTIVEAAQALYRDHTVESLSRSEAGATNLTVTSSCVLQIIAESESENRKAICFVTGVPGAGKTLAGLNIATQRLEATEGKYAVFLSGNGPLVMVLRSALARDQIQRARENGHRVRRTEAEARARTFIQPVHLFRAEYLDPDRAPPENTVIFDEAQRAWDRDKAEQFMKRRGKRFSVSEPEFLIGVMDRKKDWCTLVCLVGGGQEINTGEAGLTEWINAIEKSFGHWDVHVSNRLTDREYSWGTDLHSRLAKLGARTHGELHLSVSIRSFRAENVSGLVDAIIDGDHHAAAKFHEGIKSSYSCKLTRNIQLAKKWLAKRARGTERYGIVASSGGKRLRPDGVFVGQKIEPSDWFLGPKGDVRSSYYMEDTATEFDIQGLELDWVGICWDADLRWNGESWERFAFRGTKWQVVRDKFRKAYVSNAYRVLLTRARQGMVIFVPEGTACDPTRPPHFYEATFQFLRSCGLEELEP
jgi:hypothetical protein